MFFEKIKKTCVAAYLAVVLAVSTPTYPVPTPNARGAGYEDICARVGGHAGGIIGGACGGVFAGPVAAVVGGVVGSEVGTVVGKSIAPLLSG